ncbi:MAG: hypothetical protein V1837_03435 [Candidatus Woesearchaeota archaeon]
MLYNVKVFYDPKTMNIELLQKLYEVYSKQPPSTKDLEQALFRREGDGLEMALTEFNGLENSQAMELIRAVSQFKDVTAEMSDIKDATTELPDL